MYVLGCKCQRVGVGVYADKLCVCVCTVRVCPCLNVGLYVEGVGVH